MSSAVIGLVAGLNLPLERVHAQSAAPTSFSAGRAGAVDDRDGLAGIGTDFRLEVGSSLADNVISVPALGALPLLLRAARSSSAGRVQWPIVVAGPLSGLAVGTKPTMLGYAVGLLVA